jgi:hypothetical protein
MATIRIDKDKAQRIIAERLRSGGALPADANETARVLADALLGARETEHRPALKGWRMLAPSPEGETFLRLTKLFPGWEERRLRSIWSEILDLGAPLPDDLTGETE